MASGTAASANKGLTGLAECLRWTEEQLRMTDQALRLSQPPVPGKIGIRWWAERGGATMRMPVLVTWHPVHGTRWRAKRLVRLRRDRINRKGSAALCADETYALARLAQELIARYREVRRVLSEADRRLNACCTKNMAGLQDSEAVAIANHRRTIKKLVRAGYDVDAKSDNIADRFLSS